MRVLVTGASGFVGRTLCAVLAENGMSVIAATRTGETPPGASEARVTGDLAATSDDRANLDRLVAGTDAIVHLAARVHVMDDRAADPLTEYRRINVATTRNLADAAMQNGIRRFVFLSSVKVNGEATPAGHPFTEKDAPDPADAYGRSKWEAELALASVSANGGLEPVILRVPLIYGPGVKANFLSLLKLCDSGLPLPFGGITENRRSLLYVGNLANAIFTALTHDKAAGQTFLVSDGAAVSTVDLVRSMRRALGRAERLIPLPPALLNLALASLGKAAMAARLTGSLEIDNSRIAARLGWHAPLALQGGLAATAAWYRREQDRGP